ncbi:MAG: 16S rRNA (guanine(966)-N(2))-methyltransferase RsmD [Anaerovoracaceae bacterium]
MRIIAGDFKGRKLESPLDKKVRPTTDKVKEAMFSILMNDTYDRVFCDLFAGTGNLGLEALSRGAKFCYFGDSANESIRIIKSNVTYCKANDLAKIIHGDYTRILGNIGEKVDIFLVDPPYNKGLISLVLEKIEELDLLAEDGKIVVEHPKEDVLPDEIGKFKKTKEKKYGRVVLSIYM